MNRVYGIRETEFSERIIQKGIIFHREDGSSFMLKMIGEVKRHGLLRCFLYKYLFSENGENKILYLNESSKDIFEYIMNADGKIEFFKNCLVGKERISIIFNQDDLENAEYGHGYPGKIAKSDNEYEIAGDCDYCKYAKEDFLHGMSFIEGRN